MKTQLSIIALLFATAASAQDLVPIDPVASLQSRGYWRNAAGEWETKPGNPLALTREQLARWGWNAIERTQYLSGSS